MAAPTVVRVESTSLDSATIRWTYGGSNLIEVYRAPHGGAYTELTNVNGVPRVAIGTLEFVDSTALAGVFYDYKLSDDKAVTFSSVVSVVIQTCPTIVTPPDMVALPLIDGEVTADQFNELSQKVQAGLNRFVSPSGKTCIVCVANGALVIDCLNYDGCATIEVPVDQDINSISLPDCDDADIEIQFVIPPNGNFGIGGWPKGIGFTGDEGHTSPVSGGSTGRIIIEKVGKGMNPNWLSGKSKPGVSTKATKTGGLTNLGCSPGTNGELAIKALNPDGSLNPTNSLNCFSANKGLKVVVCGGKPPYTISKTGSITLGRTTSTSATVAPPTNSGSAVAGVAYQITGWDCQDCTPAICGAGRQAVNKRVTYNCDDSVASCGALGDSCAMVAPSGPSMVCHNGSCAGNPFPSCNGVGVCPDPSMGNMVTTICDARTAPMIAAGCVPCGLNAGATVSATDSLGTVATIVLTS